MTSRPDPATVAELLAQSARDHAKAHPQGTSLAEYYEAQAKAVIEWFATREGNDHA